MLCYRAPVSLGSDLIQVIKKLFRIWVFYRNGQAMLIGPTWKDNVNPNCQMFDESYLPDVYRIIANFDECPFH